MLPWATISLPVTSAPTIPYRRRLSPLSSAATSTQVPPRPPRTQAVKAAGILQPGPGDFHDEFPPAEDRGAVPWSPVRDFWPGAIERKLPPITATFIGVDDPTIAQWIPAATADRHRLDRSDRSPPSDCSATATLAMIPVSPLRA